MTERLKPEQRRREIADAALKIVAERGVGRLTAAEIAREVGVTDAALFHHFRGMDEIVLAVVDRAEQVLFEELPADGGDPLARLGEFFRGRVATIHRNPGAGRLVLSEILTQIAPPSGVARVRAFGRRSVAFIRSCLEEARRAGQLADDLEVPDAVILVLGPLMALTQARAAAGDEGPIDVQAERVWRRLEQTLRRPPRLSTPKRRPGSPRTRAGRHAPSSTSPRRK